MDSQPVLFFAALSKEGTWAARSLKLNWLRSCFRPASVGGGAAVAAGPSSVPRRSAWVWGFKTRSYWYRPLLRSIPQTCGRLHITRSCCSF